MENHIKGTLQNVSGKLQDSVGGATGDADLQAKGKVRQAAGAIQQSYGAALESVRDTTVSKSLATLSRRG